jgi:hypothetical protein
VTSGTLVVLKLVGVAGVVAAATLLARRHGHRAGGLVGGLPLIAGPVSGALLLAEPVAWVRDVAWMTLACLPATLLHAAVFARLAARHGATVCLLAANGAFAAFAALLGTWAPAGPAAAVLAMVALWAVRRVLPPRPAHTAPPGPAPWTDLPLRVGSAVALAAVLIALSASAPAAVAGWLLALPITGNVLPAFARARHGPQAAVAVVHGFVAGLGAFFGFFAALALGLTAVMASGAGGAAVALAWCAAVLAAPPVGWAVSRLAASARRPALDGPVA